MVEIIKEAFNIKLDSQKNESAPVAQRTELHRPKVKMGVQFSPGAPERKSQAVLVRLASLGD